MHAAPLSPEVPEVPEVLAQVKAPIIPEEPGASNILRLVSPTAVLDGKALRVSARIYPAGYGTRWLASILLDTDRNPATGYAYATGGAEFVALAADRSGPDSFPVHYAARTGYGDVAGLGTLTEGDRVTFEIPLGVIGQTDGVALRLGVFALAEDGSESGMFRIWDGVAVAPVAAR